MKNGGTTLIFRLSRPAVLRITIVRVYPSCERIGSFKVRAHAGVNRIRFRGRFRGRALPAGGYRLVVRARGAERDAAAIPIVIARGKTSPAALREARNGSACTEPVADLGVVSPPASDQPGSNGGRLEAVEKPVAGVAGAVAGAAKSVFDGVRDPVTRAIEDSPFDDPFVLTIIGLLLLTIAFLGTLLFAQVVRSLGVERDRDGFA
jgi:hypothetical protein